ncbi:hypothetical protein ACTMTJ_09885 [Phytohabitans sp. LJ34]|uniref:hypothetical protein n=1 Tax=Phytohabitans sp. LJ34 TaxID=3452217 RepID=UPI003F8C1EFA
MSQPTPDAGADRPLVWAPEEVRVRIEQQVEPGVSLPRRVILTAVSAFVLTWPLAFLVFMVTTLALPSVTNDASVGTVARWALWFAALLTVAAVVAALRQRAGRADEEAEPSTRETVVRIAIYALFTGVCAGVVLAPHGLSLGQIAVLTVMLIVVLHLMPVLAARLLHRRLQRRQDGM